MSRAPRTIIADSSAQQYLAAWQGTMKLLREGNSFSGREANCMFLNCGDGRFARGAAVTGLNFVDDGRAVGVVDWDQDGDLDLWLHNRTGPRLRLMLNQYSGRALAASNWLQVRLQGTQSNRDAIGARVEVIFPGQTDQMLMQTLYAGDSYLSQSSKWLHFGLGDRAQIEALVVRWPSGRVDRFAPLAANARYLLVEGQARPVPLAARGPVRLVPSAQESLPATGATRTQLVNRVPLPLWNFLDDGQVRQVRPTGHPVLLCFWASWCAACRGELRALSHHADQLRAVGLDVLALAVDEAADQPVLDRDWQRCLQEMRFPFLQGAATPELLDKLNLLHRVIFNQQFAFEVPQSLLIDENGQIAAVYRGALDVNTLVQDVRELPLPPARRRETAVPLNGRWASPLPNLLLRPVARIFRERGYREDYAHYLAQEVALVQARRRQEATTGGRRQFDERLAQSHFNLGRELHLAGELEEAIEHYTQGLEWQPNDANARFYVGLAYQSQRKIRPAIQQLRRATELDPGFVAAYNALGKSLRAAGEAGAAIACFRQAVQREPKDLDSHFNLGVALFREHQLEAAIRHFETVLQLQPDHVESLVNLGMIFAGKGRVPLARRQLQRAVNLRPDHFEGRINLGAALLQSGQAAHAVEHFRAAIDLRPADPLPHVRLATALRQTGADALAADQLQIAIQLDPRDARSALRLAWLRATSPDAATRNAVQAVHLAKQLNTASGGDDPRVLDTLAAACAEAGNFRDALEYAERALRSAKENQQDLKKAIQERLLLYRRQRAYREPIR